MMRKIVAALSFLLSISVLPVYGATEPNKNVTFNACIDKSGGVTSDMLNCISAEYGRVDKQLNASYKRLMAVLSPDLKKRLQETQRLWLKYTEANCDFYMRQGDGTSATLNASSCALEARSKRAAELAEIEESEKTLR